MTTTTTNRTGSDTIQPATINDKITLKAYLRSRFPRLHWRDIASAYIYRNASGIAWAIKGFGSGDINCTKPTPSK